MKFIIAALIIILRFSLLFWSKGAPNGSCRKETGRLQK
jgi:hypothetical protein